MREAASFLESAGLRITQPRLQIARILFADGQNRHVSAEQVYAKLESTGVRIALATVYNTLGRFVSAGLLRPISARGLDATLFDTNMAPHHHFLNETTGELTDIPEGEVPLDLLPKPGDGSEILSCELVIRTQAK